MTTLDQKTVAALTLSGDKRDHIFRDDDLHGFGIRVRFDLKGRLCKTWCVQYRTAEGKQRRQTIGKFPRMNAATARTKAGAWLNKVHDGVDPAGERAAAKIAEALKFSIAVEQYLTVRRREVDEGKLRPSTYEQIGLYLTGKHFASLHSMTLVKIEKTHVNTCLNAIPTTPSRAEARTKLNSFFMWAAFEGHALKNPVAETKPLQSGSARDRVLSTAEIHAVWNACPDDDLGRLVKLLLLTGCRAREIGLLKWSEIDLDAGTLTVPGERVKNGRTHTLPLPPLALQIIQQIEKREGRDFLFGKRANGFTNWNDQADLVEPIGLAHWTLHDLRRTMATHMCELGIEPHIVEAILNHASGHKGGVAGIYNRATYAQQMKVALARWASHIDSIVSGTGSNVVPLHRAS
jgi:integrase